MYEYPQKNTLNMNRTDNVDFERAFMCADDLAVDHQLAPHGYSCGCVVMLPAETEAKCPAHGVWS